jgi:TRAP-type C4-dicarboxylate transport system permease small subunit
MMRLRTFVLGLDDWLVRLETGFIVILVSCLTGVTFAQVVTRYLLGDPLIWSEEAARYLFVWVSMIGAALAIREGSHFGLDFLIRRIPEFRPILARMANIVMIAFLVVVLKTAIDETRLASMQFAMTFPMRMHWAYLALPVGSALMLFHLLINLVCLPTAHVLNVNRGSE